MKGSRRLEARPLVRNIEVRHTLQIVFPMLCGHRSGFPLLLDFLEYCNKDESLGQGLRSQVCQIKFNI
jgi:hypothetical protein